MADDFILKAKDVKKAFGLTPALQGASLEIKHGEILAIMGPSGSGKSTLLHCLAGIFKPDSGEVWLEGRRLDQFSETQRTELRRTAFGFVFQFGQLVPELTAEDNIALPLLFNGTNRKDAYAKAATWIKRLQLEGLEQRRSGELSGGQAQRVALARAMVTSPKVLFADEPTGSLDSLNSEKVMDLLVDIARADGATVVIVTHDARVAASADREVIVRDGKVSTPSTAEAKFLPRETLHTSDQPFLARTVPGSVDVPKGRSPSPETALTQKSSSQKRTRYPGGGIK